MTTDAVGRRGRKPLGAPRRITVGVRVRILAIMLVLTALGMAAAGIPFTLNEQRQLLERIDAQLRAEAQAFKQQAERSGGTDDVTTILEQAVGRPVPSDVVTLGMLDGRPRYVAAGPRPFALENLPNLLAEVRMLPPDEPTRLRQIQTSVGLVRYVAIQVQVTGRPQRGTFVVAQSLGQAQSRMAETFRFYTLLSAGALLLVAAGGWVVAGRLLRPLRLLRVAAERISHTDLTSRIPLSGAHDDVTDLARTVNAMLDRLQSAFDAQQQFLDDAGHELRTPLTIVRGHMEVLDVADPAEVESTRQLVVDELDRMSRLVSDLIILAQAGRPDFVRFEAVDLDRLLQTVLGKAEALAERQWLLDSKVGAIALADEQRLTQAMLQLADNAVKHTEPDEVIAVGGALSRAGVLLWVRDTGRGVAPADAERIFERFGRAGSARGHDGSGLGLSIVSGIAAAHSGRVTLEPQTPHGACFTLRLPLTILARTDQQPPPAMPHQPPPTPPGQAPAAAPPTWGAPLPARPAVPAAWSTRTEAGTGTEGPPAPGSDGRTDAGGDPGPRPVRVSYHGPEDGRQ